MRTRLIITAPAVAACLAAATSAGAAVGGLTYQGCLADTSAEGCFDLPYEPFQGASSVALSQDGRSVYVTGSSGSSISHLFRTPATGALALDGCLNGNGSQNCGDLAGSPLFLASDAAVSPDGRSVYVTAYGADAIAHFFRTPGGQLFYDGCLANEADDGCVDLPGEPLEGASGVAVSPDGTSVYVAGATLARFAVNGSAGQIAYAGCLNNDGFNNCVDLPGDPLEGVNDVAVSADGKSVYAVSFTGDALGVLLRDGATGKLDWDGCVNDDGSDGCENLPGSPLDGALGVAVSGDGRSVYVSSAVGDSLSHLARSPATGGVTWVGCLNNDGSGNCIDVPGAPLDYAAKVAVSPDGRSVYVASYEGDSVAHGIRDPRTGRLAWGGSIDSAVAPLNGAQNVTVSPDGKSVLVATAFSSAIVRFARELPAPAIPSPPVTRPDTIAPAITGLAVTTGRRLRYTLSERATVTIRVARCRKACRVQRRFTRAATAGSNRLLINLQPGRYRARLVATDAAGNRSARATVRFRVRRR